jgi:hypothetical protein
MSILDGWDTRVPPVMLGEIFLGVSRAHLYWYVIYRRTHCVDLFLSWLQHRIIYRERNKRSKQQQIRYIAILPSPPHPVCAHFKIVVHCSILITAASSIGISVNELQALSSQVSNELKGTHNDRPTLHTLHTHDPKCILPSPVL